MRQRHSGSQDCGNVSGIIPKIPVKPADQGKSGRQLDASPATIDVLPRIADALRGRGELLLDGGVRRGADVIKAIALGARAVLIGRPVLWGLAADGRAGVAGVLAMLRRELDLAMALCGCANVESMTRDLIAP